VIFFFSLLYVKFGLLSLPYWSQRNWQFSKSKIWMVTCRGRIRLATVAGAYVKKC